MKTVTVILSGLGGELARETIEVTYAEDLSNDIVEAISGWTLAPGDTIQII